MREFFNLVYNESEKIYRKKRLAVVMLILLVIIPMFVYAQYRQYTTQLERLGTKDWRLTLQQQIVDSQNRLNSSRLPDEWRKFLQVSIQQQQFYLDQNINPNEPGAPTFMKGFIENAINLFVPLLVMVIAIDIVSGERTDGTIKMLLTRPIRRWKVLLSKYVAMLLYTSLVVLFVGVFAYLISGVVFGFNGWTHPLLTGFVIQENNLSVEFVHSLPQWKYLLMAYGFAWFVSVIVGTIAFMLSIVIRNTPAGMGAMLAILIAGGILGGFAASWEGAKYIFSTNLQLTDYLSGRPPTLEGLTLSFSLINLSVWGIVALIISFFVFTKQDMVG